jgi:hypothetical protein
MKFINKLNKVLNEKHLVEMPLVGKYVHPKEETDEEPVKQELIFRHLVDKPKTWEVLEQKLSRSGHPINFIIFPENIDSRKAREIIDKQSRNDAINIPVVGNVVERLAGDDVKGISMTKWMLVHQIGEAVIDKYENIDATNTYDNNDAEGLLEEIKEEFGIPERERDRPGASPVFTIINKMLKTKAARSNKIEESNDLFAEYITDLLWHGKIRRHKTAEEIGIPISTEEMHAIYDKIENIINDILDSSVGKVLEGAQLYF